MGPLLPENLEHRQIPPQTQPFNGGLHRFNWRGGWGFLIIENQAALPDWARAKMVEMQNAAKARGRTLMPESDRLIYFRKTDVVQGTNLEPGHKLQFKLYTDDKGL